MSDEECSLAIVTSDPTVRAVLERAPALGVGDWWLTAGILFQTVWNEVTGRPVGSGIRDADLFYFDRDTSWDTEDAVIRAGAELFADLPVPVEIRVYAPHGYDDLFSLVVRPNRLLAPRHVYEAKTARWSQQWPDLTVLPWDDGAL